MIHVGGFLGLRYTTPRRSSEVFKKILSSVQGASPCVEAQQLQVALCPVWGFSLSLLTTSVLWPSCSLKTLGPFSSIR